MPSLPLRLQCRGLVVDAEDRILLVAHAIDEGTLWIGPGGGVEEGETREEGLRRELLEEVGLDLPDDHPLVLVWAREVDYPWATRNGFAGVDEQFFLLRTDYFEPSSGVAPGTPGHPDEEGIIEARWWTPSDLAAAGDDVLFGPRVLPTLLATTLARERSGALPSEPVRIDL
ncbi:NUDIX domain-containing protein [Promicromonospora sp. Populi]|uniref:NUDIX domain-containing protein n=1 Tax=Promicromonospora sp. Populi TaxID=3239420 RepID=UPI0034E24436